MDWEVLLHLDKSLLLALNGSDSLFVDGLATVLTTASTWIPLYVALLYVVINNNDNVRQIMLVVACAAMCVLLSGTIDDTFVKPLVARWRPTHDPEIGLLVDVVNGYRGGKYGFFSAHAANTFSIAVFFSLVIRSGRLTAVLISWSLVNCWTRMYLGVHFPGDILCGLAWGGVVGLGMAWLYGWLRLRCGACKSFISTQYTSTGYAFTDIDIIINVVSFTLVYVIVRACFMV
jgi:undecaprenyl-diphosphatase